MRALVIGGNGFFGSRVVKALRAASIDVVIGGKSGAGGLAIDVGRVEPAALKEYDAVVNCADTIASPPDRLHEAALKAGIIYVEPTAEPGPISRALARRQSLTGGGIAILGAGIFPGLSNLAARAVYEENGRVGPVEVAMRFSPFTGAGGGMVSLIAHLMAEPAPYFAAGTRHTAGAFSAGHPMPFEGTWRRTLRAAIPETDLLHATLGAPDVLALLSPQPSILMPFLRLAAILAPPWKPLKRAYLAMIRGSVGIMRRIIFRKRPTYVVVSALAGRTGDAHEGRYINLSTPDGILCGAYVIAATLTLVDRSKPTPGTYVIDELVKLDAVLAEIAKLPGAPEIRAQRGEAATKRAAATA